jgi:hypothetical protein
MIQKRGWKSLFCSYLWHEGTTNTSREDGAKMTSDKPLGGFSGEYAEKKVEYLVIWIAKERLLTYCLPSPKVLKSAL